VLDPHINFHKARLNSTAIIKLQRQSGYKCAVSTTRRFNGEYPSMTEKKGDTLEGSYVGEPIQPIEEETHRALKPRQISMIAIGGAIGEPTVMVTPLANVRRDGSGDWFGEQSRSIRSRLAVRFLRRHGHSVSVCCRSSENGLIGGYLGVMRSFWHWARCRQSSRQERASPDMRPDVWIQLLVSPQL